MKGAYEKLIFQLLDEDTFSRDDLLGTLEIPFADLESRPVNGELPMIDAKGEKIGVIDMMIEYEEGDGKS